MAELIRISEAAKRLGITRQRMYKIIEEYHIPTVNMFDLTLIDSKELERPEIKERRGGRPPKDEGVNSKLLTGVK